MSGSGPDTPEGAGGVALRPPAPPQPARLRQPGEPVQWRDRWCIPAVFLISLLVFISTNTGQMIFDTKLGVDIDAAGFLARIWPLWNPLEWFGTLQNQYIGYAIPMAPFFLLGQLAHVPVWLIERLWLATIVTVGFAGLVRLARSLGVGTGGTRLLGAAIFVLWPAFTIEIGSTSAGVLPGLVVPWAVLPLVGAVRGQRTGGRAAVLSGLAVTAMGGVNAASTLYVLVLPALSIFTLQEAGFLWRARLSLFAKWAAAVLAATAWWWIPLLLQGGYSFNFLPYIEQSATTMSTMSAAAFLRGAGTWTAYLNLGTPWLPAGWSVVTSAAAILAAAAAVGAGLYGLARRDMPARRWLLISVGVTAAVALAGYPGPLSGPLSGPVDKLFDGTLAPLRSVYKLEPVIAVALALGCAHAVSRWISGSVRIGAVRINLLWIATVRVAAGRVPATLVTVPLAALALVGLAVPQLSGKILQPGAFASVPAYWNQAAAFLAANSPRQTALVVPADAHGLYLWGDPIDDPMEPLAGSPWAERALVPYGGAGSQVFLDTAEQAVESDEQVPGLPAYLARAGVRYVVVRNDLSPSQIGYVSPQVVNETLTLSGFERVASFGPQVASSPSYGQPQPLAPGQVPSYPAVEVFQATDPAWRPTSPVTALPVSDTALVNGGPDSLLQLAGQGVVTTQPTVIAGDPLPVTPSLWAVTDGQRRADDSFGLTDNNVSFTYTATETNPPDDTVGVAGAPPDQLLPVPAAGHQTVAVLSGAAQVTASSYGYWLDQAPQYDPVNAFDGDSSTAWAEGSPYTPVGQWLQIGFDHALSLPSTIGIQLLTDTPSRSVANQVKVSTAAGSATTDVVDSSATQTLRVPSGSTSWLRITITGASNVVAGNPGAGFSSVLIPGVKVTRYLQPAEDPAGNAAASTVFSFSQPAPSQAAGTGPQANPVLARDFSTPGGPNKAPQAFGLTASAVATPGTALDALIAGLAPASKSTFQVVASSTWDSLPEYSPANLFDGGSSPWIAGSADPNPMLHVTWQGTRTIRELVLTPASGGAAAFPTRVQVASPQGIRVANVGQGGVVQLNPPLKTSQLYVSFPGAPASETSLGGQPVQNPVGLAGLSIPGLSGLHVAAPNTSAKFQLACGQGPAVSVDGATYPTSVSGTVADLIQSLPVQVQLCAPGSEPNSQPTGQLTLAAGQHALTATPTSVFTTTSLALSTGQGLAGPEGSALASQRTTQVLSWQPDSRGVRVGVGAESYLEVHENFNAGWTASLYGKALRSVELDGWQQAFIVPAGTGGVITLTYSPTTVYHVGILVSAAALLTLVILAFVLPRRRRRPPSDPPPAAGAENAFRPMVAVVAVVALALVIWLAGGVVVLAVPVLFGLSLVRPRWLPPVALAAMLVAGVAAASAGNPAAMGTGAFGNVAQAGSLVALAAALMPALDPFTPVPTPRRKTSSAPVIGGERATAPVAAADQDGGGAA